MPIVKITTKNPEDCNDCLSTIASDIRLLVGDQELEGVSNIKIHEITNGDIVTATLELAVRLG